MRLRPPGAWPRCRASAARAVYALKLLQSEGALTIVSTGKDPATGCLVTHEYRVEGSVAIFLTTTAIRPRRRAAQPSGGEAKAQRAQEAAEPLVSLAAEGDEEQDDV